MCLGIRSIYGNDCDYVEYEYDNEIKNNKIQCKELFETIFKNLDFTTIKHFF